MNSPTAQFVSLTRMGIYEPIHQISMWGDFKGNVCPNTSASMIEDMSTKLNSQSEDTSQGSLEPPNKYNQEAVKPADRVLRRLAQNREAARKSRLRKKAYVQQLETSRLKLIQLEQELAQAKHQGLYIGGGLDASHLGYPESVNPGIAAFEMEYVHWVEEQKKQVCELRTALNSHVVEIELRILVDGCMNHYFNLFSMKATAAKADVFYIMSGLWKKPAERFFLWIGGFRPSELLMAEDALSQGMDKLQQILSESVAAGQQGEGSYIPQVTTAMEKLEALVSFVNQADHLRQETLQQMSRILTTHETAMALLALGEYFQCLQALSSLWASRPREPA